jgi:hypothetical protein
MVLRIKEKNRGWNRLKTITQSTKNSLTITSGSIGFGDYAYVPIGCCEVNTSSHSLCELLGKITLRVSNSNSHLLANMKPWTHFSVMYFDYLKETECLKVDCSPSPSP